MVGRDRSKWTVRDIALRQLRECGDRIFVQEVNGESESYQTFIGRSIALSHFLLGLGVKNGETVAIFTGNGLPGLHAWLSTALIGAVEVPINPSYRADILLHILTLAKPAVVVADNEVLPALAAIEKHLEFVRDIIVVDDKKSGPTATVTRKRLHDYSKIIATPMAEPPAVVISPWDTASIMFTSGTTGPSKGVVMPNGQVCLLALQAIQATSMDASDVFYCVHPTNHIAGKFMGVLAAFASGGRLVLDRRFDARHWLERVRRYAATISIAHGPMIEMIYQLPTSAIDREHSMRRMMCCPLPKQIASQFESRFALRGVEMWGMTEVGCPIWTPIAAQRIAESCGRALSDWYEVAIVNPETDEILEPGMIGEIVVRPRYPWTTMQGYLGMPQEAVEAWRNLWFHSGDAARVDSDGNFFYIDRIKDRIRRRAENISSYDIETVAKRFPGVQETAAVGVPSNFEGDDDIKLCIVPDPTIEISPLSLLQFLAAHLTPAMVPRYIEFLAELPRTPTNKVRKRDLRNSGITSHTWDRHAAGVKLRGMIAVASANGRDA